MVVEGDVLSLKPILDLRRYHQTSDVLNASSDCSRDTRVSARKFLLTSLSTSLTNLFDGLTARSVLLHGTHPTICEVTVQLPKLFDCNNSRTTHGQSLFMFKGSAFCSHKNHMNAWSCSFVQQPVSKVCFTGIKQETFVSDLSLYVHRKTEENKTVNA
jgi:hypothetical protein